ncbi:hypothetical protein ACFLWI_04765 [Chloroflexota bacterium]
MFEFPNEMFLPGSDLTPIEDNIDKIIDGLIQREPEIREKGEISPLKIAVEGEDYQGTIDKVNNLFLKQMWADGLPVVPPTEERVTWLLTGTDLPRDTVIGKILPRGGIATIETLAVALAMAGGRPEYLPVLIAAVEALIDPRVFHQGMQATTNSNYPVIIVNGPIAKQIRLNSGYGCLGPDPTHPAGASIGRALRFLQMNVGGAVPGVGTMSIYGGPARYTNIVFAEDEDGLPSGWEPLSIERGFPRGSNVVTLHAVNGTINVCGTETLTEETALATLHLFAAFMRIPNYNYFDLPRWKTGAPGVLLMGRGTANGLAQAGWSKEEIRNFLWENSKLPWSLVKTVWGTAADGERMKTIFRLTENLLHENEPWPISSGPESIMIAVAGGAQSGHGYWMPNYLPCPVSKDIKLPVNWETLVKEAEVELGPLPSALKSLSEN